MHITADGITYSTFYPATSDPVSSGTGWHLPNQNEWSSLYRGGNISGNPDFAYANIWSWYQLNPADANEGVKGYEIKPDGATTTLFLPASGNRYFTSALLYRSGVGGYYWSGSITGVNALGLLISSIGVNPTNVSSRGYGYALRCAKN